MHAELSKKELVVGVKDAQALNMRSPQPFLLFLDRAHMSGRCRRATVVRWMHACMQTLPRASARAGSVRSTADCDVDSRHCQSGPRGSESDIVVGDVFIRNLLLVQCAPCPMVLLPKNPVGATICAEAQPFRAVTKVSLAPVCRHAAELWSCQRAFSTPVHEADHGAGRPSGNQMLVIFDRSRHSVLALMEALTGRPLRCDGAAVPKTCGTW